MYTWLFLCSNFLPVGAIASVVALCGGLFIMVGGQEQGFSLISRAGIAKAILSYTSRAFLLKVVPQYS
ncbi:hypothetical protein bwei_4775 [Bacillus mycoides]|uniref:hypothetical protein n=1 Tax=Bacillus TaxID=1386 RepID=UPI0001A05173|nr:hypothetical protein [Bacillus mycoides]EEL03678.1 hypothetical protein bcere0014_47050 [Bacillus cereus BDRD-ST196]KZD41385.1 hypothetical protein B4083_1570 [Bacillus cereus]AIW87360.1 hypothetical protein bwei_4775 [Bacillus mycoides]TKI51808.1 hypothetical protein FC700_02650 [Bacillus mycoides]GAE40516.1 hypothetical protein BW1_033_00040 [Bacillus mycoides NBRC 101238 = DSM 11821]